MLESLKGNNAGKTTLLSPKELQQKQEALEKQKSFFLFNASEATKTSANDKFGLASVIQQFTGKKINDDLFERTKEKDVNTLEKELKEMEDLGLWQRFDANAKLLENEEESAEKHTLSFCA